jgi:bifunctional enzyme CysN/CysC
MRHREELARGGIAAWLEEYGRKELLRILTCGSVDDGKSTLIGRLLHDGAGVFDDQLSALKKDSSRYGTTGEEIDFALLMDGLQAEREQGITIDVAYRYFSTPKRKFIIADTPGHEQYTRNMATGASTSDLAIILIDARKGVLPQTRRHAFICSLLGIRHVVIAINKMDLVDYSEQVFETIKASCVEFLAKLQLPDVHFIPMSARRGENVVESAAPRMPWYQGGPLLSYLESVHIASDRNLIDLRLPVQLVLRPNLDFRGFAGTLASGVLRVGEEVVALPSGKQSRVKSILRGGQPVQEAFAPMAITITLEHEIDVSRGDVFVRPKNAPTLSNSLESMVVWMNDTPLQPGRSYLLKTATSLMPVTVTDLRYRMNIESLRSEPAAELKLNEIGRVRIESARQFTMDAYAKNRQMGAFILIDRLSNATLAAGMALERASANESLERNRVAHDAGKNLQPTRSKVEPAARAKALGQKPFTLWLTGLPRSGKSSLAFELEKRCFERGLKAVALDGEQLRQGLCSDLGFSGPDREENLRRAAELARVLNDQGLIVIAAFVSATRAMRAKAQEIIGSERFLEAWCNAPLAVVEARDTSGLFARARAGEIGNVTGIDHQFEPPSNPAFELDTVKGSVAENIDLLLAGLTQRGLIPKP